MSSPIPALFLGPPQFARTNIGHVLSLGGSVRGRVWEPDLRMLCALPLWVVGNLKLSSLAPLTQSKEVL